MTESTEEKMVTGLQKHWKTLCILLLIVALIITVAFLCSLLSHQREIEKRLERQNFIIDSLEEKQSANTDTSRGIPVISSETLKSELRSLQELVTQKYIYTNADKRTQDAKWIFGWSRPFSKSSLILTYDGTIKAGIDMSEVQVDVNEESCTITITLPKSKITDNNIPQESITVVEAKDGLFNEVTLDDYNEFIKEQKIIMEQKAIDRGLLDKADEEARKAVESFLSVIPGIGNGNDEYKLIVK